MLKYQFVLKFRDGSVVPGDVFDRTTVPGDGDFLKLLFERRESNASLTVNMPDGHQIVRRYDELESVEIVLK